MHSSGIIFLASLSINWCQRLEGESIHYFTVCHPSSWPLLHLMAWCIIAPNEDTPRLPHKQWNPVCDSKQQQRSTLYLLIVLADSFPDRQVHSTDKPVRFGFPHLHIQSEGWMHQLNSAHISTQCTIREKEVDKKGTRI